MRNGKIFKGIFYYFYLTKKKGLKFDRWSAEEICSLCRPPNGRLVYCTVASCYSGVTQTCMFEPDTVSLEEEEEKLLVQGHLQVKMVSLGSSTLSNTPIVIPYL